MLYAPDRLPCYHSSDVFALFLISMTCFFALFAVLVALLHRAKVAGAREATRAAQHFSGGLVRGQTGTEEFGRGDGQGPLPEGLNRSLSSLVPGKQPDWGFMVRDGGHGARGQVQAWRPRKQPVRVDPMKTRPDWAYYNEDSGDLRDPYEPVRPLNARRA